METEKIGEKNLINNTDGDRAEVSDPEVTDNIGEELDKFKRKLMPYHRYIMIIGIIVLILLVVFLGYAYGGLKVCADLDGLLDSKFKCHPNFTATQEINTRITRLPDWGGYTNDSS